VGPGRSPLERTQDALRARKCGSNLSQVIVNA